MSKSQILVIRVLLSIVLIGSATAFLRAQTGEMLDRIAAVVGSQPILLSDINSQAEFYALNNHLDPNTPGLKKQVLDAMVNEKLMLAKALEDTNITVTEDQVTSELDALIAQRVQQVGSEKRLEDIYGMSITRMKREFRDETRDRLLVQALQQSKFSNVRASRQDVEDFYQQYKDSLPNVPEEVELYHIFRVPKVGEKEKVEVRARAQQVLDSIKAGGDFAAFARRYSEDPGTASSGGDLGFVRRGEFFPEFEAAAFSLSEGQLSNPVESPLGYHIIQLIERRGEEVHVRHILFRFQRDSSEADSTIAFLNQLRDSVLHHGANFSALAKRYSEDKETASLGGFLGQLPITQFDQSVITAIKGMKDGDISDPIEVPFEKTHGFQIILLKSRTPEHAMTLTTDWNRLEQMATSYKQNIEYQNWLSQLRSEIYVDIRL